jgi:hypothetical protein
MNPTLNHRDRTYELRKAKVVMAETGTTGGAPASENYMTSYYVGGGANWLYFAGFALMIVGIMRIFDAIWAFGYKGTVPSNLQHALFGDNLSTYGWLWLVVGIILILSGVGVFARNELSRWVGIFAGGLLAVTAIWWMPYYPVWSFTYIILGVAIVYALATHGQRQNAA